MRALVTGCAGFIGSHLTESLLDAGHSVVGIDCFNDNYGREQKLANLRQVREWTNFEFVPIDLSRGDLGEFVRESDVVFHLAAEPGVRSSWGSRYGRYVQNNIMATQHILQAARAEPALRVVFASSSSVYGSSGSLRPSTEESPTRPISPYGQTKLSAEQLCGLHREEFGMDIVCLRYFTVFGPRQRPDMAFHRFLRAALNAEPITIFGDGGQTRDFTYVGDIVSATLAAGLGPPIPAEVLNIGGGAPTSLHEVLAIITALTGAQLDTRHAPREHGDARDTVADSSRARALLGFRPTTTLEAGLAAELEWLAGLGDKHRLGVAS